jgi:hypothetical protein
MRLAAVLALTTAACAGCGGGDDNPDGPRPDARVDASIDATQGCTGPQDFTGELIDFDSSPTSFLGVFDARYTLRGDPGCEVTTAPNGRFVMTLPAADAIVDIDLPTPYLDALATVPRTTITAPMATFSMRGITEDRMNEICLELGMSYDNQLATVIVYQAVDPAALTLTNSGPSMTSNDGTTWDPGNDGAYVVFTNVVIDAGTQTLDGPPSTIGLGPVPVETSKVTYVTTLFALE